MAIISSKLYAESSHLINPIADMPYNKYIAWSCDTNCPISIQIT